MQRKGLAPRPQVKLEKTCVGLLPKTKVALVALSGPRSGTLQITVTHYQWP